MYKTNAATKQITPLSVKRFSDLGFSERHDLQEWLANTPEALGEELLIIQKDFDGFNTDEWPAMRAWMIEHMGLLEKAMRPMIDQAPSVLAAL